MWRLIGYNVKELETFVNDFTSMSERDQRNWWPYIVHQKLAKQTRRDKGMTSEGNTVNLRSAQKRARP